jgi:hypothetical protein
MRHAAVAGLDRALGNVEEAGYGTEEALSAPTITTTVAEPASAATELSIGCAVATPKERATVAASAACPLV